MSSPFDTVVSDSADALTRDFSALLRGLGFMPATNQVLDEKRVIQAAASNTTKYWSAIAAAAGGALSIANILAAWKASEEATKVALIGAASVTLAATVIGVALLLRSDLVSRSNLTRTLFQVRSDVVVAAMGAAGARAAAAAATANAATATPQPTLADLLSQVAIGVPGQNGDAPLQGIRRGGPGQPLEVLTNGTWTQLQGRLFTDVPFSFELPSQPAAS